MDQPWPLASTTSNIIAALTCTCLLSYCSVVWGVLMPFFHILFSFFFSESPGALHSPIQSVDKSLALCFYRYLFELKCTFFFLGFDKRRAIPEGLYHVLFCCPGRYVLVMNFSSLTFANRWSWQIH